MKADKCTSCRGDGFYRKYRFDSFEYEIIEDKNCYSCFGSGFDTKDDYYVVCPHCGYRHDHCEIEAYESSKGLDCEECGKEFELEVETRLTFSTFKIKG